MRYNFQKIVAALFASAFAFLATTSPSFAQDLWIGPPGPGPNDNWFNGNNWSLGAPPTGAQNAQVNNGGTPRINSGTAEANNLILGNASGESGTLRINNNSELDVNNNFFIGDAGTGTAFLQDTSITFVLGRAAIGNQATGVGEATVRDGAKWFVFGNLTVGDRGDGTLRIRGATDVEANRIIIGDAIGALGTVDVTGTFSKFSSDFNLTSVGNTVVGDSSGEDNSLDIHDGGRVGTGNNAIIGNNAGSNGFVRVGDDGPNSESYWFIQNNLAVGDSGTGELRIHNGGFAGTFDGDTVIGRFAGSVGLLSVDGSGLLNGNSIFTTNNLYVGGNAGGPGGDGTLRLTDGGTVEADLVYVWGGTTGRLVVNNGYILTTPSLVFDGGILRFLDDTDFINAALLNTNTGDVGVFVDTNDTTSTISSVFSGDGGLTKRDTGTLILTNDNTYTGDTIVNNGTLLINGSVAGDARVRLNGTLGGTYNGTFDNVRDRLFSHGIVSPGDFAGDPQTFVVGLNYLNHSDGTFVAEIGGLDEGVESDLLRSGHTVTLEGGTLQVIRINNFVPSPGDRVTIIRSDLGRTGEFDTLVPIGWFGLIQPDDVYDNPFTVDILFVLTPFSSLSGLTINQECVGENLDDAALLSDPDAVALVAFVGSLFIPDLPAAYDLLAPEELASIYEVSFSHAMVQGANFQRRLSDIRVSTMGYCDFGTTTQVIEQSGGKGADGKTVLADNKAGPVVETCPDKRWGVFATAVGQFAEVRDDDENAEGYEFVTGGFTTGVDYRLGSHFAVGIGGGYAHSTAELVGGGEVDVGGAFAGVYGTVFGGGFYLDMAANGGWNNYDTFRVALDGSERGSTDGAELNALIGGGYDWKWRCWTIGPTANFQYTYVEIDSFTEGGDSAASLHYPDQDQDAARSTLGLKIAYEAKQGNVILRPEMRAAWQHEFGDTAYAIDWNFDFEDEHICSVFGPNTGRDSALLDAGFSLIFGRCSNVSAYVFYNGNLGRENYERHAATGGLRVSF